uniref:Uncharacterized protein n=1 Tax=Oryza punctata TaxID=4537 RepID=A0A0E0LC40_ORYPU
MVNDGQLWRMLDSSKRREGTLDTCGDSPASAACRGRALYELYKAASQGVVLLWRLLGGLEHPSLNDDDTRGGWGERGWQLRRRRKRATLMIAVDEGRGGGRWTQ